MGEIANAVIADDSGTDRLLGTISGDISGDVAGSLTDTAGNSLVGTTAPDKLGFYGETPVVRPTVPLTTPDAQDVIDALVLLGLVEQSD